MNLQREKTTGSEYFYINQVEVCSNDNQSANTQPCNAPSSMRSGYLNSTLKEQFRLLLEERFSQVQDKLDATIGKAAAVIKK